MRSTGRYAGLVWPLVALILSPLAVARAATALPPLDVPIVVQTPERCGPAALEMVLRFHGAGSEVVPVVESAFDPVLHGTLITELARASRRAGFAARIATLSPDSLVARLSLGLPTIVLFESGRAPFGVAHYAVVTGWNSGLREFTLLDGKASPRRISESDLARRWRALGSQALMVTPAQSASVTE